MRRVPSTRYIASLQAAMREIARYDLMPPDEQQSFNTAWDAVPIDDDASRLYVKQNFPKDAAKIFAKTDEIVKEKNKRDRSSRPKQESTTTPYYITTPYYNYTIRSWGGFIKDRFLYIEQINENTYLYNADGEIGLAQVMLWRPTKEQKNEGLREYYYLSIKGIAVKFNKKPISTLYRTPSLEEARAFAAGTYQPREIKAILSDVKKYLNVMYDFGQNTKDPIVWQLHVLQSYLEPLLNAFFYVGIDATKGGGKTTLLEIAALLCRHGFMAGDISPAALPRLVDEQNLAVFADEIDEKIGKAENDLVSILRKGQRRGNPYVRCEGRDFVPKAYDVAGAHGYSYRSEIEDAFRQRTLDTHSVPTTDNRLAVLNCYKEKILKPLAVELFLWSVKSLPELYKKHELFSACSNVVGCSSSLEDIDIIRKVLFESLTQHLPPNQLKFLDSLCGRNAELAYLVFDICKLVDIDLTEEVSLVFTAKQENESAPDTYYLESLQSFIATKLNDGMPVLADGVNAGCRYYPKNQLYQEFVKHLTELKIVGIGTKKYSSMLRDFGFQQGVSLVNQRYERGYPRSCLIFSSLVTEKFIPKQDLDPECKGGIIKYISEHPNGNALYIDTYFSKSLIESMMRAGDIYEPRRGTYGVLQ